MLTQTNTSGVDFILNALQAALQSTNTTNTLSTNSILPLLQAVDPSWALQLAGRVPGGQAYQKGSNGAYIAPTAAGNVVSNTNAGVVALTGFETRASKLPCTKNGAFILNTNSTNTYTLQLTNTATNTNGQVGDTVFASWNQIIFLNLSGMGIDAVASAAMKVAPSNTNGANFGPTSVNTAGEINLDGNGGVFLMQSWNGVAINAAAKNYTVIPTAGGIFCCVICGA